jgi:hypothetical protein
MMGEDEGEIDWKYRAAKKTAQKKIEIQFAPPCARRKTWGRPGSHLRGETGALPRDAKGDWPITGQDS